MDKRKGKHASDECLKYFLNKYRDSLMKKDNERRQYLKEQLT